MTLFPLRAARLALICAAGVGLSAPLAAQSVSQSDAGLAAETLGDGRALQAIAQLEYELEQSPRDPALLINLGIAQAQMGRDAAARDSFEAALRSREVIKLETADGRETDSRRLARLAISMLERGEFRSERARAGQFTLRD